MSFQEELRKAFMSVLSVNASDVHSEDYPAQARLREKQFERLEPALTSIINLVDKELPKFIDVGKYDLDCPPTDLHRAAGYNQAISNVRKVLGLKDV